ncbi:hypothetical protein B0T21DRAFT_135841 [Apiosordaria backusii]|uniref:Uncharacterized protein n=1 Tax=Apiosordaria backusii TaxID=314023 RepID=A0AA40BRF2_9PEZI|nr:hypothetical protein B0T21DRAFT_135841 [Apiosordaria backusii]
MAFFNRAPAEMRLKIYNELLVQPEPIKIVGDFTSSPPRLLGTKSRLHPQILRVNKQAYAEASSLLYSGNKFQFPDRHDLIRKGWYDQIAPSFAYIGPAHASVLRYIGMDWIGLDDHFEYCPKGVLRPLRIELLQLIRDTCPNLRTIQMTLDLSIDAVGMAWSLEPTVLSGYNGCFKDIPSLEEVIIDLSADELDPEDPDGFNNVDDAAEMMLEYGWTVNILRRDPEVASVVCRERFESDEDYSAYTAQEAARRIKDAVYAEIRARGAPLLDPANVGCLDYVEEEPLTAAEATARADAEDEAHALIVERMRQTGFELNYSDDTWDPFQKWLPWTPIRRG